MLCVRVHVRMYEPETVQASWLVQVHVSSVLFVLNSARGLHFSFPPSPICVFQ